MGSNLISSRSSQRAPLHGSEELSRSLWRVSDCNPLNYLKHQSQLMGSEVAAYGVQVATYGVPHKRASLRREALSPALRIPAIQTRHAAIHQHHRRGAALCA